jgi:drug/metabolite transporter (DMT)-like permease
MDTATEPITTKQSNTVGGSGLLEFARVVTLVLSFAGAGIIISLAHFRGFDLFNIVYLTYSAQIALFPCVIALLAGYDVRRAGEWSILLGLGSGLLAAVVGIVYEESVLLTWAPSVGLLVAMIPLVASAFGRLFGGRK